MTVGNVALPLGHRPAEHEPPEAVDQLAQLGAPLLSAVVDLVPVGSADVLAKEEEVRGDCAHGARV